MGIATPIDRRAKESKMQWIDRIEVDEGVAAGKPIIRGTRLTVEFVIDLLAQGWRYTDILNYYPDLTLDDIRACLTYASAVIRSDKPRVAVVEAKVA